MTTTRLSNYTTGTLAITSLNGLASDVTAGFLVACSQAFSNTSQFYLDVTTSITVTYTNAAPTLAYLTCYYAPYFNTSWSDDGYGDAPDGTDQTITIGSPTVMRYAGTVPVVQNQTSTSVVLMSVGTVFGFVPPAFSVVVHNGSGQTLKTSSVCDYVAVTATTA